MNDLIRAVKSRFKIKSGKFKKIITVESFDYIGKFQILIN